MPDDTEEDFTDLTEQLTGPMSAEKTATEVETVGTETQPELAAKARRRCEISGCSNPHYGKGMCRRHYQNKRNQDEYGDSSDYNVEALGPLEDWVYIREIGEFYQLSTGNHLDTSKMGHAYGRGAAQLAARGLVKSYWRTVYDPKPCPPSCLNLWKLPPLLEGPAEHGAAFPPEDLAYLLKNLGGDHYAYLLEWLAYSVQHPGEPSVALVLHGVPGAGKGVLSSLLGQIYGAQYSTIGLNEIQSEFNGWLENKLVIVAEEITVRGFRERERIANMMKQWVMGGEVTINRKYQAPKPIKNYSRWLIFSNDNYPVAIDDNDRRYSVIRQTTPIYPFVGHRIIENIEANAKALANFLKTVNIEDYHPMSPLENDDRQQVQTIGRAQAQVIELRQARQAS